MIALQSKLYFFMNWVILILFLRIDWFSFRFLNKITNKIIVFLCPEKCWIPPKIVILPLPVTVIFHRKYFYCQTELFYHSHVQLFHWSLTSGLKIEEQVAKQTYKVLQKIKMSGEYPRFNGIFNCLTDEKNNFYWKLF